MDKVTLNNKEQKRLMVLNEVLAGRFTGQQAAEVLRLRAASRFMPPTGVRFWEAWALLAKHRPTMNHARMPVLPQPDCFPSGNQAGAPRRSTWMPYGQTA